MLFGVTILASTTIPSEPIEYTALEAPNIPITVKAQIDPKIELQTRAKEIAEEYGISFDVMFAIIETETGSTWKTDLVSDTGDYGLVQINLEYHPEITKGQALDPEFSMKWLASEIKEGREWKWTGCSCIQTAKALGVKVSGNAKDLKPNSSPKVGGLILMKYGEVYHVAVIMEIIPTSYGQLFKVREGNYQKCKITEREIRSDDRKILGYWVPSTDG